MTETNTSLESDNFMILSNLWMQQCTKEQITPAYLSMSTYYLLMVGYQYSGYFLFPRQAGSLWKLTPGTETSAKYNLARLTIIFLLLLHHRVSDGSVLFPFEKKTIVTLEDFYWK